jgi:hypothetical protein
MSKFKLTSDYIQHYNGRSHIDYIDYMRYKNKDYKTKSNAAIIKSEYDKYVKFIRDILNNELICDETELENLRRNMSKINTPLLQEYTRIIIIILWNLPNVLLIHFFTLLHI